MGGHHALVSATAQMWQPCAVTKHTISGYTTPYEHNPATQHIEPSGLHFVPFTLYSMITGTVVHHRFPPGRKPGLVQSTTSGVTHVAHHLR